MPGFGMNFGQNMRQRFGKNRNNYGQGNQSDMNMGQGRMGNILGPSLGMMRNFGLMGGSGFMNQGGMGRMPSMEIGGYSGGPMVGMDNRLPMQGGMNTGMQDNTGMMYGGGGFSPFMQNFRNRIFT